MTVDDDSAGQVELDGLPPADAIERVLEYRDDVMRSAVRPAIQRVASGGTVSYDAAAAAIDDMSATIMTIEDRFEAAENAIGSARNATTDFQDIARLQSALEVFDSRFEAAESIVADLEADLDELRDRNENDSSLYAIGRDLVRLENAAESAYGDIDELVADIESFEAWVRDPNQKFDELETDAEQVEELLDVVEEATEEVRTALEEDADTTPEGADLLLLWIDAVMRNQLIELLLQDLLSELEDLQTMADLTDASLSGVDAMATRLQGLESRRQSFQERIDRLQRPDWPGEFEPVLESYRERLGDQKPPVDWGAVQSELQSHRQKIEEET